MYIIYFISGAKPKPDKNSERKTSRQMDWGERWGKKNIRNTKELRWQRNIFIFLWNDAMWCKAIRIRCSRTSQWTFILCSYNFYFRFLAVYDVTDSFFWISLEKHTKNTESSWYITDIKAVFTSLDPVLFLIQHLEFRIGSMKKKRSMYNNSKTKCCMIVDTFYALSRLVENLIRPKKRWKERERLGKENPIEYGTIYVIL